MKTIKIILNISILTGLVLMASCKKDFLDETLTTDRNMEFFKTDAGILSLSTGTYYQVFALPFSSEWAYCTMNYGVDEFSVGGDPSNGSWNNYDAGYKSIVTINNANTATANVQWDTLYTGIGDANLLIQNAIASTSTSDAIKKVALGEGYFFRAYNYLRLVSQYGAVPLKTEPSTKITFEYTRATPEEVCKLIIDDFKQAYNLLPNTGAPAKITKDAAAHYLAKAYLYRASEINDSWNSATKAADLAAIVPLCDEVISHHPLATNFADLWKYTAPDAPNEKLPELILSAEFTADVSTNGTNTQHLYWGSRYDDISQMQRDITGDRPFSRLRTNYYMFRIYDQINDSRFWKGFRTKWRLNKTANTYYVNGDLGIMFLINQPGDSRYWTGTKINDSVIYSKTGKKIPNVYVAYPKSMTTDGALLSDVRYPPLSKHMDGSRIALNETRGLRDLNLARSAETYLIAAEAKIRLAKIGMAAYTDALPYINKVRARAQFVAGEDRAEYYDGGAAQGASGQSNTINSFIEENSYYESNNIPPTTAASASLEIANINALPAGDEFVISQLGLSGDYDRMLALVLDERSRELAGEYKRWEDLSRTKTLVPRVKAFNAQAAGNIRDIHVLRPIPQTYLDGIQSNGKALSADEKQSQQNPGF